MFRSSTAGLTKGLNWSQFVLEGLQDFLHVLTPDGRILYASPSCKTVTGFERNQLEGRFVSAFIHPDDYESFINALNQSVSCYDTVRFIYRFRKVDWEWAVLESFGRAHVNNVPRSTLLLQHQNNYQGFFITARPYFSNNGTLFDSFLELKVENERLLAQKAALDFEEQADHAAEGQEWEKTEGESFITHPETQTCIDDNNNSLSVANRMAPSETTSFTSITAPTQRYLSPGTADGKDGPITSKVSSHMVDARYLGGSKLPEARTNHVACTFMGDVGIPISVHGNSGARIGKTQVKKNKKKQYFQASLSYICTHCSTSTSPEWRKGPLGPKTLCNACGCRLIKFKRSIIIADRNSTLVKRKELRFRKQDAISRRR